MKDDIDFKRTNLVRKEIALRKNRENLKHFNKALAKKFDYEDKYNEEYREESYESIPKYNH
jgi:hypothetical protein